MMGMTDYMFRIGCAFLMGALIGLERQFRQHNAGLRTNILVALASAAFTVLSVTMTTDSGDPSRVAAQIVSGIGFLGGGLILKEGFTVRGLNTAATIWCSAACGTLSGVAMYKEGFVLVIFVLLTHCLLRPLCKYIVKCTTKVYHYTIRVECQRSASDMIQSIIMDTLAFNKEVKMNSMFYKGDGEKNVMVCCDIQILGEHKVLLDLVVSRLRSRPEVSSAGWDRRETPQEDF